MAHLAHLTRRKFLAATAASGFAAPMFARAPKPGDKLNLAVIGVNDRGAANLAGVAHENIVALCDVDEEWSARAREEFPRAAFFTDYRKMFDKVAKEIDAVVISTPDHSHALPAALAMTLDKHVYCEKPLTPSVNETRHLIKLAADRKLVTQMGTQIHAGENYRRVVEIIQAGKIGPVRRVHVWNSSRPVGGKRIGPKPSAKFDIDLWLGPNSTEFFEAAMNKSQWNFAWPHFHWRWWWEFGGGTLADLGCHYIDLPYWALGLSAPSSVSATGKKTYSGDNTTPDVMQVDFEFPGNERNPPVHLTWYHGVGGPGLEAAKTYKGFGSAVLFVGDRGNLISDYTKHRVLPEELDFKAPAKSIPASIGHHKEWCEAIKNGGETTCNFGYSGLLTEAVLLGNVAYRCGKTIKWDSRKGTTGNTEADALLGREYRKRWELPGV
jgi:predicted dehydrogenase